MMKQPTYFFALFLASSTLTAWTQAQFTITIPNDLALPQEVVDMFESFTGNGEDNGENGGGLEDVADMLTDIFDSIVNGTNDGGREEFNWENATANIDFEKLFEELSDLIGESLKNITFPPEIQQLFDAPELQNYSFSFGGNCTICDDSSVKLQGTVDNMACDAWSMISKLGVVEGTDQCDLLRVAAAQFCGCPVPDVNAGRECPICPNEGEVPANDRLNNTLAVGCLDLLMAPAVDGDKTCNTVADLANRCACSVITSFERLPPEAAESSAVVVTPTWYYGSLALLVIASALMM